MAATGFGSAVVPFVGPKCACDITCCLQELFRQACMAKHAGWSQLPLLLPLPLVRMSLLLLADKCAPSSCSAQAAATADLAAVFCCVLQSAALGIPTRPVLAAITKRKGIQQALQSQQACTSRTADSISRHLLMKGHKNPWPYFDCTETCCLHNQRHTVSIACLSCRYSQSLD